MTMEAMGKPASQEAAWIPSDDSFAARLALVRWRMGWNIKEAALACGVPAASWRLWEIDKAQPRRLLEVCALIAERTGCDYGWLLDPRRLRQGGVTEQYRAPTRRGPGVGRPAGHPTSRRHPEGLRRPAILPKPVAA